MNTINNDPNKGYRLGAYDGERIRYAGRTWTWSEKKRIWQ